jgi:hypothetical protein
MEIKLSNQELVMMLVTIVALAIISYAALYHVPVSALIEGYIGGLQGSKLNYSMGNGVGGSWESNDTKDTGSYKSWYKSLESNKGGEVPLPEGQLSFYADTRMSPECCPSTYSGSTGCVCPSVEQVQYLNERGGNRTLPSEF